jgi:hypothetical protein
VVGLGYHVERGKMGVRVQVVQDRSLQPHVRGLYRDSQIATLGLDDLFVAVAHLQPCVHLPGAAPEQAALQTGSGCPCGPDSPGPQRQCTCAQWAGACCHFGECASCRCLLNSAAVSLPCTSTAVLPP